MSGLVDALRRVRPRAPAALAASLLLAGLVVVTWAVPLRGPIPGIALAVCAVAAFALTLRRLALDAGTIVILLATLALYVMYLGYTQYGERNYDGPAQLQYVQYIASKHAIPPPDHCFICHHPPAYYLAAAAAHAFFERTRIMNPVAGVQVASLAMFMPFVVFAVLLARRFSPEARHHRLVAALVGLWPYSFHNAVRVHNDTLVGSVMVVALYFIVRFYQEGRRRDLYLAGLSVALAVLTKSSAYAVAAILGVVVLVRLRRTLDPVRLAGRASVAFAIVVAAMLTNAARQKYHVAPGRDRGALCERVLGSACRIADQQLVGNGLKNYVYFDLPGFVAEPYLITERDETGRQLFWNDLLKTSLFGTHNVVPDRETAYELNARLARVMNVLLLAMIAWGAAGYALAGREGRRRLRPLGVCVALFIAFAMAFRALIPAPHHNDFRHVFPLLALGAVLFASAAASLARRWRPLRLAGYALALPFVGLSVVYFVPKYDWAIRVTARTIPVEISALARIVPEGTPWDKNTNRIIEGNHTLELAMPPGTTVTRIDTSLDSNDRYEVRLFGRDEVRTVRLGPRPRKGLARYVERVDPPVLAVSKVTLRPVNGDKAYSLGHLVLR